MEDHKNNIPAKATFRAFLLGLFLSGFFAWFTVIRDNFEPIIYLSVSLMPSLPYIMLVAIGLFINPFLERVPIVRPFNLSEKLLVFVMCAVSSSTASFGLSGKLVPLITSISNEKVNTVQSELDVHSMPFLNEDYFIVGKGTQEAAIKLRKTHLEYEDAKKTLQLAKDLNSSQTRLKEIAKEKIAASKIDVQKIRELQLKKIKWSFEKATKLLENTQVLWDKLKTTITPEETLSSYPEKIKSLKDKREKLRTTYRELNSDAFAAVKSVREGFSDQRRAIPGFIYIPGEGSLSYFSRYNRLSVASGELDKVENALSILNACKTEQKALPENWDQEIIAIAKALSDIDHIEGLQEVEDKLNAELVQLETDYEKQNLQLKKLRNKRRFADVKEVASLNDQIEELETPLEEMNELVEAHNLKIDHQIKPLKKVLEIVAETQNDLNELAELATTAEPTKYPLLIEKLNHIKTSFNAFDASYRRYFVGDIPWGLWIGPITNWLVLVFLAYLVFMTFNTLIYRQWAHNEKLIYPIAEVTTLLASDKGDLSEKEPVLFKSGLFWFGFILAAGVLGWNYLAGAKIIPNISPIVLETGWHAFVGGSILEGSGSTYFCIIFAVIGLTFLVPSNISFSFWFFELGCIGIYIVLNWLGYGGRRWEIGNYPRNNLGGGAMLIFGLTILWTSRQYLFCVIKSSVLKGLDPDEKKELRVSSFLFIFSIITLILMLTTQFNANIFHTILYLLMALIITIAMIRSVAEGGILGIENSFGAFSFITKVFGTSKAWVAAPLFAPLMLFNAMVIGSLKGFIAPTMANSLKIRDKINTSRLSFHFSIWIGIVVAVVVSLISLIVFSYDIGENNLDKYMHDARMPGIKTTISVAVETNPLHVKWITAGAILMTILLISRRAFFWVPHPIGLVAFINPVMWGLWGSIMIGWVFKIIVSKYCSKEQYLQYRCFFIGLVIGHLFAGVVGWSQVDWHWG